MTTPATSHALPSPPHFLIILYLLMYVFSSPHYILLFHTSLSLHSILECSHSLIYLTIVYPFFQNEFKHSPLPEVFSDLTSHHFTLNTPLYYNSHVVRHYYFVNRYPPSDHEFSECLNHVLLIYTSLSSSVSSL